jgi:protein TilB
LYLQNNIISRMENLFHLKDLVYLNLALNNITAIEGLHNCEFLSKLDLTVNFVDFDTLKDSIEHLQSRSNLKELFMMGNPSEHLWKEDFSLYVVAKLPQLHSLDGTEVTRSLQIKAAQKLPLLEVCYNSLLLEIYMLLAQQRCHDYCDDCCVFSKSLPY